MSALRPLPPRPNLDFERKEAKALLRRLRAGDPEALSRGRAQHPAIDRTVPAHIKLADAQLVIAREYGFASWPRLVRYYGDVERQRHNHQDVHDPDFYHSRVRSLLAQHRERRGWAARQLAAYVPRFYGLREDDVYAATVSEDDARLAVARNFNVPNWELLLERAAEATTQRKDEWHVDPMRHASNAMQDADLDALKRVIEAHPDLLHPSDYDAAKGRSLLATALYHEETSGHAAMRPIMEWLLARGLDVQRALNARLCGHMYMKTDTVRRLLERGADPNWIAPNGLPVLEHALIRYWNGEAVDLVATRTVPRRALWISAGLGHVDEVRRFLDRQGKPTPAARQHRPDFQSISIFTIPTLEAADDEEILMEAFWVALLNARSNVMEYLVSRGFNVNSVVWGAPIIYMATGNAWVPQLECLLRCGADLDLRGWGQSQTAREVARWRFVNDPTNPDCRRVIELCGMDPDTLLAAADAERTPPRTAPRLEEALGLASEDAFRLGQSHVTPENLLFGLLRGGSLPLLFFTQSSGMDVDRFRAAHLDRVRPKEERLEHTPLALDAEAQAALDAAMAIAVERRRDTVNAHHLLLVLTRSEQGFASELLKRYGGSPSKVNEALTRSL